MDSISKLRALVIGLLPASSKALLLEHELIWEEDLPDIKGLKLEDNDALQLFVQHISEELGDMAEDLDDQAKTELSSVFFSICMIAMKHVEEATVTLLLQNVLPLILSLWKAQILGASDGKPLEGELNWPKSLWSLIVSLTEDGLFGPEETCRCLMILSRTLVLYLPYSRESGVQYDKFKLINFDLRREDGLSFLLLDGLESDSAMARKEALRVLKSVVAFSTAISDDPSTIDPSSFVDEDSSTRIFCWMPEEKQAWIEAWSNFFLLYESLQQPQAHIVSPMLPLLKIFLNRCGLEKPWLGLSWWETLITRAFRNDSIQVRKLVLESVLRMPEDTFPALRTCLSFVFGSLLELCDVTAFYYPIDTSRYVSKFGELVVGFYSRFLGSLPLPERAQAVNQFVGQLCTKVKGPSPAVYMLMALLEMKPFPALSEASLEAFQRYAAATSTFNNQVTRRLVKSQMLQSLIRLGDPAQISYRAASKAIEFFSEEEGEGFSMESKAYTDVVGWIEATYGQNLSQQNLKNEVERYFECFSTYINSYLSYLILCVEEAPMEENEGRARRIAVMSALALSTPGAFVKCCGPAYSYMAAISAHVKDAPFVVGALLLYIRLDEAVRRATSQRDDLVASMQLAERIFEWIDTVNTVLIGGHATDLEYRSVMILIEGQRVLLGAASKLNQNSSLIGIVEMQLFVLLEHLQTFASSRANYQSESYHQQLLKIAVLEMMDAYFCTLDQIDFHNVGFFTRAHVIQIFDCDVEKPAPSQMTPIQYSAWSDLQVSFVTAKWKLVGTVAEFSTSSATDTEGECVLEAVETFERCMVALETAKYSAVPSIIGCLSALLPLLPAADLPYTLIEESIKLGQDLLESHFDSPKWFDVYAAAYIDYTFQPFLLTRHSDQFLHGPDGIIRSALSHALENICPKRKGLINRLTVQLFNTWSIPGGKSSRQSYIKEIGSLLMYGPVRDCAEERVIGADLSENAAPSHDYLTRVFMLTLLNRLSPSDSSDHAFSVELVKYFLNRAQGIDLDEWELKRVFPNAIQHRRKMRAWMATLLLQPMIGEEDAGRIEGVLWTCVADECMPSTRAYIEWFLARNYIAFPVLLDGLLGKMDELDRPAAISVSNIVIAQHVALHLDPEHPSTAPFMTRLMDSLGPYCADPNSQTRVTACWALRRVWERCSTEGELTVSVLAKVPKILAQMASSFNRPNSQLSKAIAKQDLSPTLAGYDPVRDFSLEFLFYHYPKMLGMATDELITPHSFRNILLSNKIEPASLLCPIDHCCEVPNHVPPLPNEAPPAADHPEEGPELFKDFQRKLAVWDLSLLEEDLSTFRRNRELEKRKQILGETIVCASLVDKVPNLAGLSRTCEIFGATRLTVPDAKVLQDPQFKAISMTSDKWLQIDAVPPSSLINFLEDRRREGFRILAVEQTSASFPLQSYNFPARYVLVLGNESSGIPPEILHVVDDCIEIPQNGMIRSLNVHVCGSIVLWESRRQLYAKNPAAVGVSSPPLSGPSPANTVS